MDLSQTRRCLLHDTVQLSRSCNTAVYDTEQEQHSALVVNIGSRDSRMDIVSASDRPSLGLHTITDFGT